MIELALVLALMLPAFLFAYIGLSLGDDHQVMSFFLVMMSMVMSIGVPFTGMKLASDASYTGVASYFNYFELAVIVTFVLFVFYFFWLYLQATGRVTSGTDDSFDLEENSRGDL